MIGSDTFIIVAFMCKRKCGLLSGLSIWLAETCPSRFGRHIRGVERQCGQGSSRRPQHGLPSPSAADVHDFRGHRLPSSAQGFARSIIEINPPDMEESTFVLLSLDLHVPIEWIRSWRILDRIGCGGTSEVTLAQNQGSTASP